MVEIVSSEATKAPTQAIQKGPKKDTWSKKSWYNVEAPKVYGGGVIAEVPALKPAALAGRTLKVSLSDLTKNYKHFQTNVKLRITNVSGKNAETEYAGQEMMKDALARMIRRWSSRVDSVQEIKLAGKKMRLKTVVITKKKANTSAREAIRAAVIRTSSEALSGKTLDEAVADMNSEKLSRMIFDATNKIFPVKAVEVRRVEVE